MPRAGRNFSEDAKRKGNGMKQTDRGDGVASRRVPGDYRQVIKLAGGYRCILSPREMNEWHEHLTIYQGAVLWDEYCRNEAELDALRLLLAGGGRDPRGAYAIRQLEAKDIRKRLYLFGKKWFEEVIVPAREAAAAGDGAVPSGPVPTTDGR